jgi:hypothetical protein
MTSTSSQLLSNTYIVFTHFLKRMGTYKSPNEPFASFEVYFSWLLSISQSSVPLSKSEECALSGCSIGAAASRGGESDTSDDVFCHDFFCKIITQHALCIISFPTVPGNEIMVIIIFIHPMKACRCMHWINYHQGEPDKL